MVLLVPDDIPEESLASTIDGNVEEMCALFKNWDPRYVLSCFACDELSDWYSIPKLLKLCESVQKWRLCIRFGDFDWTHPSGAFVILGDAVHATLPYLASGYALLSLPSISPVLIPIVPVCPLRMQLSSGNASLDFRTVPTSRRPRPNSYTPSNMLFPSSRSAANSGRR